MKKKEFINNLFDNIKDELEFDSDVIALNSLLEAMLDGDLTTSFNNWKYIICKYDIRGMLLDTDFTPLIVKYPENLIKKVGLKKFFSLINEFSKEKKNLIYSYLFNIYADNCILYYLIEDAVIKNDVLNEREIIDLIISKIDDYPIEIFDLQAFLKNIIKIHQKHNFIDLDFLMKLTEIPDNLKEQSILKTLLIDYI